MSEHFLKASCNTVYLGGFSHHLQPALVIDSGNIDNRELQAGSRVFLPVFVPGALFSIGDRHATQGDGEVNVTAIETSMNRTIELKLHKDWQLTARLQKRLVI